jgi:hypothetical protein
MNRQMYPPGKPSGSQYEKQKIITNENNGVYGSINTDKGMEDDLIFEENTVYEIDRECFERLKRQRKKR